MVDSTSTNYFTAQKEVSPFLSVLFITKTLFFYCQRRAREELGTLTVTLDQRLKIGFPGNISGLFGFLLTRRFHPNRLQENVEAACSPFLISQRYEEARIIMSRRRRWIS
jgi:hypothetical protein